eukprot:1240379-Amphidinium_carterae.1
MSADNNGVEYRFLTLCPVSYDTDIVSWVKGSVALQRVLLAEGFSLLKAGVLYIRARAMSLSRRILPQRIVSTSQVRQGPLFCKGGFTYEGGYL